MSERDYPDGDPSSPDDPFAHLFRPDPFSDGGAGADVPDVSVDEAADPMEDWEPLMAVPVAAEVDPLLPPPAAVEIPEEVSIPADPLAGRLFRSRGAPEVPQAITAVGSIQARRLRTMARADEPGPALALEEVAVVEEVGEVPAAFPPPIPVSSSGEPAPALQVMARQAPTAPAREPAERPGRSERTSSGSLTGLGVYAVTTGVTVILAFGQVLFFGGQIGAIAGIGLLTVSVFAAFAVRTRDAISAIFAPPIAFLIAALTAGQVGVNANGLSSRAVEVFFLLGENWVWIIGSTVAALVIVALRRRLG